MEKKTRRRLHKYTFEQKIALIHEWVDSDERANAFCERKDVEYMTFQQWLSRLKRGTLKSKATIRDERLQKHKAEVAVLLGPYLEEGNDA